MQVCSAIVLRHLTDMHLSTAIPGVDPGDTRGNSAGFPDFCRQCLARNGGIGPLLHFRGKIHGERPAGFVTSPSSWKWKIWTAGTASKIKKLWQASVHDSRCSQKCILIFAFRGCYCLGSFRLQDLFQLSKYLLSRDKIGNFPWRFFLLALYFVTPSPAVIRTVCEQ